MNNFRLFHENRILHVLQINSINIQQLFIQMSNAKFNTIQIFTELEDIYPDIRGELGNRHSELYGKIKDKFSTIFDNEQPQYFISVKGIFQFLGISCTNVKISMALQNGIVIALSKIDYNPHIYINSNYEDQQIILNLRGQVIENPKKSPLAEWTRSGFQICLKNETKKLNGAIIYIHNNIPQGSFGFREANILAASLSFMVINNLTSKISVKYIQQKIQEISLSNLPSIFLYENNNFVISESPELTSQIHFKDRNCKFILCNLLLQPGQLIFMQQKAKVSHIEQRLLENLLCKRLNIKCRGLMEIKKYLNINEIDEFKNHVLSYLNDTQYSYEMCCHELEQKIELTNKFVKFNPKRKFMYTIKQFIDFKRLYEHPNKETLEHSIKTSYEMLTVQNAIPERLKKIVNFCLSNNATACTIIDYCNLLIVIEKNKKLRLFDEIKKNFFLTQKNEDKFEKGIQHLLFSTFPSKGAAILKPNQETQLWYVDSQF